MQRDLAQSCRLIGGAFANVLQFVLGLSALAGLVIKRLTESPRRPFQVSACVVRCRALPQAALLCAERECSCRAPRAQQRGRRRAGRVLLLSAVRSVLKSTSAMAPLLDCGQPGPCLLATACLTLEHTSDPFYHASLCPWQCCAGVVVGCDKTGVRSLVYTRVEHLHGHDASGPVGECRARQR
jgi:hypothetical protein